MTLKVTMPRLLPATMLAMALLLGVKSVALVRAAVPAGAAEAVAPTPPPKPAAKATAEAKATAAAVPAAAKAGEAKPDAPAQPPADPASPKPPAVPPISESERTLLLDLRKRSVELDAREAALGAREAVLAAAETRIGQRVTELGVLQKRLEALETARRGHDEANWSGLVKLYETMKPRDAAAIFNDLDMAVLLPVVDRMKETKAALVLAAMLPERARQVTAELARMRAAANSVLPAASGSPATAATAASMPPAKPAVGG
jgi:flagellar motility protein MotE (MotC chaperone)